MPQRQFAKIARMRISDVQVGDVVNKYPESESGWFVAAQISRLFDGKLQVADFAQDQAVSGNDFDMIGVQFVAQVTVDEQPPIAPELLTLVDSMADRNRAEDEEQSPDPEEAESTELARPASLGGAS